MGVKTHLNLQEYADYKMVDLHSVRNAIATGKIVSAKKEGGVWVIDVKAADKEWAMNYNPNMDRHGVTKKVLGGDEGGEEGETLASAKLKREKYMALLKELEYEEKVGTLVSKDEVYKSLFEMGKEIRQEFQMLADRVIDDILAQRSRFDSHRILSDAINSTLERLTEIQTRKI